MLRTGGLACARSTRFLVGPSRLSAAHPVALLTSSRTSQRPGWGVAGSSRGLCAAPEASPKIQALVDQISGLTLLEASELTDALKEKLGISGAMMMPAGGGGGGGGPAPAAAAEVEEAVPEKLIFTIKLAKFDAATKIKLIKEVRPASPCALRRPRRPAPTFP
jgi:large subunit ribosomal protein L7/L12